MKFCPDFATNSRKERRVSLFQSNLRIQMRKLPKILKSVKIIHYYSSVSLSYLVLLLREQDVHARDDVVGSAREAPQLLHAAEEAHLLGLLERPLRLDIGAER